MFQIETEGCRRYNEARGKQTFNQPEQVHSHCSMERFHHMPQSTYFVSTNQEVQTHRVMRCASSASNPTDKPINLPLNCYSKTERVKTKANFKQVPQLSDRIQLTPAHLTP